MLALVPHILLANGFLPTRQQKVFSAMWFLGLLMTVEELRRNLEGQYQSFLVTNLLL